MEITHRYSSAAPVCPDWSPAGCCFLTHCPLHRRQWRPLLLLHLAAMLCATPVASAVLVLPKSSGVLTCVFIGAYLQYPDAYT